MNGCTEYEVAAVPKVARVDVIDRSYRIGLLDKLTDGSEFVGDNLTRIDTTAVGGSAFRLNTEGYDLAASAATRPSRHAPTKASLSRAM